MMVKILFLLLIFSLVYRGELAPQYLVVYPQRHSIHPGSHPRPFGSIGDWISSSQWFPIEINVPDTINSITNGISGITGTFSNGLSSITSLAQRIPFIHRLTSPERPRPLQYFVLIPTKPNEQIQNRNEFDPFPPSADVFPHYP